MISMTELDQVQMSESIKYKDRKDSNLINIDDWFNFFIWPENKDILLDFALEANAIVYNEDLTLIDEGILSHWRDSNNEEWS